MGHVLLWGYQLKPGVGWSGELGEFLACIGKTHPVKLGMEIGEMPFVVFTIIN